jgi:hypothetical protein
MWWRRVAAAAEVVEEAAAEELRRHVQMDLIMMAMGSLTILAIQVVVVPQIIAKQTEDQLLPSSEQIQRRLLSERATQTKGRLLLTQRMAILQGESFLQAR